MSVTTSSPTILTTREITLHLLGLVLVLSLLGLWYWLSTGARVVPTLIEMLKDDDPSTRIVAAEQLGQIGPATGRPFHNCSATRTKTAASMRIPPPPRP